MKRLPAIGVVLVGGAGLAAVLALVAGEESAPASHRREIADARDVEALARMLASENPGGSAGLWIEQCWTQINSRRRGQSLYDRITGGQGWGPQGGARPVSTAEPAGAAHRMMARLVLLGERISRWSGARKFFEPKQQDSMFALGEAARAKRARGEKLTPQEERALSYRLDADGVRSKWRAEGSRYRGEIDGVEFWS